MIQTFRSVLGATCVVLLAAGCTAVVAGAADKPGAAPSARDTTAPGTSGSPSGGTRPTTPKPGGSQAPLPCTIDEPRAATLFAATYPATAKPDTDFDVTTWVYLNNTAAAAVERLAKVDPLSYTLDDATQTIRIKGRVDATVPNPANTECAFGMSVEGKAASVVLKVKAPAGTWTVVLENFKAVLTIPQPAAPAPAQPTATITVQ